MPYFIFQDIKVPSVNLTYRTKNSKIYKTSKSKIFTEKVKEQLKSQITDEYKIYDEPIKVKIKFYLKGKRKIDCDNVLKSILDAFNGELYIDDKIIDKITVERYINQKTNFFTINIEKYAQETKQ